ncbi:hypothetical protein ABZ865_08185 [Streptomyces sp. NPDC047085]|uniref:hypothetical protein n=1 Tax=Streptomyces sp. NPDC047085 TaxID=3155140 RepID=UPI003405E107
MDALFAARDVCGQEKEGTTDTALLAHQVSEDFGLEGGDAAQVVMAADVVFCIPYQNGTLRPPA